METAPRNCRFLSLVVVELVLILLHMKKGSGEPQKNEVKLRPPLCRPLKHSMMFVYTFVSIFESALAGEFWEEKKQVAGPQKTGPGSPLLPEFCRIFGVLQEVPWKVSHDKEPVDWRQIWRVAGRESGFPELLGSPRTSPEVPRTSPEVFGDFPGSSLTVELNSNPEVPRKFPKLSRKFPKLPRKFRDFPGGQPLSLGSLTPSPYSQKLALS